MQRLTFPTHKLPGRAVIRVAGENAQHFLQNLVTADIDSLKPGQAGVAVNQSHRTVYVVRVVSQEPSDDVLKEQFLESGQTPPVRMVANFDAGRIQSEIFESLDEELSLVWQRKPIEASRR